MARRLQGTLTAVPPLPALAAVLVMVVWAFHDGGYDADTWYWGALVMLALVVVVAIRRPAPRLSRPVRFALVCLSLYVAWSYLSIAWSSAPGDALEGSNRSLLYLLLFALFAMVPWTGERALWALVVFVVGVALVEISVLVRLAQGTHAAAMFNGGRLATPTGYYNASAALFTLASLVAVVLASRRELPALLRGLMFATACAGIHLALLGQSRGWLFTLPAVLVLAMIVVRERLRIVAMALLPLVAALAALSPVLHVWHSFANTNDPRAAFKHAGMACLIAFGATFLAGTVLALVESRFPPPALGARARRAVGAVVITVAILVALAGGVAATHGHPFHFVSRQWSGFANVNDTSQSGTHFGQVGTSRYDFWRVSLRAFLAHPIGGLGQDNFGDYYVTRRRTIEEPKWTHSIELRLLAHTGIVGFLLFAGFLVAAFVGALRGRRRGTGLTPAMAAAGMLPVIVWLLHGSVDWFWEMPALTGPALGFLALAGGLGASPLSDPLIRRHAIRIPVPVAVMAAGAATLACTAVLGLPYLSVREVSTANHVRSRNPEQALRDLATAADLNPLSAEPGRVGGTIALQSGRLLVAEQRFGQAIHREPGGWYAWLGRGLAESALGESGSARRDFAVAAAMNTRRAAVRQALARVDTLHPMTPAEAFKLLFEVR